ncbi:hypothetical protein CDD83_145 [Cordyceps sp. RAO-2017]|nr:hypothetical protein CDD83_145 [Cordyceps sp. RAO-2017]
MAPEKRPQLEEEDLEELDMPPQDNSRAILNVDVPTPAKELQKITSMMHREQLQTFKMTWFTLTGCSLREDMAFAAHMDMETLDEMLPDPSERETERYEKIQRVYEANQTKMTQGIREEFLENVKVGIKDGRTTNTAYGNTAAVKANKGCWGAWLVARTIMDRNALKTNAAHIQEYWLCDPWNDWIPGNWPNSLADVQRELKPFYNQVKQLASATTSNKEKADSVRYLILEHSKYQDGTLVAKGSLQALKREFLSGIISQLCEDGTINKRTGNLKLQGPQSCKLYLDHMNIELHFILWAKDRIAYAKTKKARRLDNPGQPEPEGDDEGESGTPVRTRQTGRSHPIRTRQTGRPQPIRTKQTGRSQPARTGQMGFANLLFNTVDESAAGRAPTIESSPSAVIEEGYSPAGQSLFGSRRQGSVSIAPSSSPTPANLFQRPINSPGASVASPGQNRGPVLERLDRLQEQNSLEHENMVQRMDEQMEGLKTEITQRVGEQIEDLKRELAVARVEAAMANRATDMLIRELAGALFPGNTE